jgi:hypothetical protein
LIRVHIDDDKSSGKRAYSPVGEQSVADAGGFLDAYLRNDQGQEHGL